MATINVKLSQSIVDKENRLDDGDDLAQIQTLYSIYKYMFFFFEIKKIF